MTDRDLEKLWQQIDADLEHDDAMSVAEYLQGKGLPHSDLNAINEQAQHLINQTFAEDERSKEQIEGKYKIIEQIDSGGQSDVFLAERSDGVYQQRVVIKFISGQFEHPTLKQQFLQEMQLLADLRHPGVVTIIDGNITEQGQPWLVLDHIDGAHIDQFVRRQGMSLDEVVQLIMRLCDTLQFVHQNQVFHKDIKPGNVLVKDLNGTPFPVLIDFGIAMQHGDQATLNFGTRGYSAPEQINGQAIDHRTDLYALGMLFAHLLLAARKRDHDLIQRQAVLQAIKHAEIPKEIQQVILKLTDDSPDQRYQNADALRSDLNQWQLGFPLSFDSHKLSSIVGKTAKRHPWTVLGLVLTLVLGALFAVKYTRDTQHLQQLTIAEKNATDALMNFMLEDLFEGLERIGRIDVLQSVVAQSVDHLEAQDVMTLDANGHLQTAKAYLNAGRVYDHLEQSEQANNMYLAAEKHLQRATDAEAKPLDVYPLAAKLKVYQSQVLSSDGQEQTTESVLLEAIEIMNQLIELDADVSHMILWEANLELGYHLMEYAKTDAALKRVTQTVDIATKQLEAHPNAPDWLYANSQSMQMKAWYELDFGDLAQGIADTKRAIDFAQASLQSDAEDLKKQNNERILYNQLAFFYLENQDIELAKQAALKAVELGDLLKLKAPFNQEYEREQAYSFSTAGEILQQQGDLAGALRFFQQGLAISQHIHDQDPDNYSAANDLAVDSLLVAGLQTELGQAVQATEIIVGVEHMMDRVHQAESNNKYYAHTLLVAKLHLKKYTEAKALYELAQANDMIDAVITDLMAEHGLDW